MPLAKTVSKNPRVTSSAGGQWFWAFLNTKETRQSYALTCIALWSLCFYLIITNYVGGRVEVDGESMMPTLRHGETYILNRWAYHFRAPKRGDIIVIRDPGYADMAIKRVVGIGGERVEFKDATVFVNGVRLKEYYLPPKTRTFPAKDHPASFSVPRNHFLVLGDNRGNSMDGRYYGPLHRDFIVGLVSSTGQ
jgi:signal peptidase I